LRPVDAQGVDDDVVLGQEVKVGHDLQSVVVSLPEENSRGRRQQWGLCQQSSRLGGRIRLSYREGSW
jgi:hypothetical protein